MAYVAGGACAGVGLGLLVYRFAMQPIGWDTNAKQVFQIGAIAAMIVAGQLLRGVEKNRVFWAVTVPSIVGWFAATFAVAYQLVPPPGHATLSDKSLPGFSIKLPGGEEKNVQLDYMAGRYQLVNVVGTGGVVQVQWEPGASANKEDLQLWARAFGAALDGSQATMGQLTGADGKPVDTMSFDTDKGALRVAMLVCGGRRIAVMTAGSSIAGLLDRMVRSVACHPDPAREKSLDDIPLAIDLPPSWKRVKGEPGQVSLTDGQSALLLKPMDSFSDDANTPMLLNKLFAASGQPVTVAPKQDGRYPLSGTREGQHVVGWVWPFQCGKRGVFVLAFAVDQAGADALAELLKTKGHCAGPNEVISLPPLVK